MPGIYEDVNSAAEDLEGLFDEEPEATPEPEEQPDATEATTEVEEEVEEDAEGEEEAEEDPKGQKYLTVVGKDGKAHRVHIDKFLEGTQHTVKLDGEEKTVPYKELVDGYQRQADYTRGKQEVAKEKAGLSKYKEVVGQLEADPQFEAYVGMYLQTGGIDPHVLSKARPDVTEAQLADALSSGNDEWVNEARDILSARAKAREQHEGWSKVSEATAAKRAELHKAFVEEEHRKLVEAVPDFGEKAKSVMDSLVSKYGFTEAEVGAMSDHRILRMAHDLIQTANNPPKADKPPKAPVTRGAAMGTNRAAGTARSVAAKKTQARVDHAAKTQSIDDWAEALGGLF